MTINAPGRTRVSQRERWALVARLIAGVPVTWTDEYEDRLDRRYEEIWGDEPMQIPENHHAMP